MLSNQQRAGFDLTTGYSVEAGVKAGFRDDRLIATASIYQIEQDNILTRDPLNPALTVQGGSQRSRGVELDLSARLTDRWDVSANGSLVKAEFTELIEAIGGAQVSRAGNRPLNVPAHTLNLWTNDRLESIPVAFGAGIRHSGGIYSDNANSIRLDGHTLLNASVAYDLKMGTLTLRGRNLTDAFYVDWSGSSASQVYVGEPLTVDLTYSVKF